MPFIASRSLAVASSENPLQAPAVRGWDSRFRLAGKIRADGASQCRRKRQGVRMRSRPLRDGQRRTHFTGGSRGADCSTRLQIRASFDAWAGAMFMAVGPRGQAETELAPPA